MKGHRDGSEDTKDHRDKISRRAQESLRSDVVAASASSGTDGDTETDDIIFKDLIEMLRVLDEIAQICGNA